MKCLKLAYSTIKALDARTIIHSLRAGWAPLRHPYAVWMLIPEEKKAPKPHDHQGDQSVTNAPPPPTLWLSQAEFRLMPEMLKLFDFAFACLFALYGFFFLTPINLTKTVTSYAWMHQQLGWVAQWWWAISLLALWFVIPIALYTLVLRPKTLETLHAPLPYAYRDWFLGLPSKIIYTEVHETGSAPRRIWRLACELVKSQARFMQFPTNSDPVVWQPVSSGSTGLLYLAMAQYFSAAPNDWQDTSRATFRFLITYCSSIWTSFIWLIVTISIFRTPGPGRTLLCFAWTAMAIIFLLWAVYRYGAKQRFHRPIHLRALPIPPLWDQARRASDYWIIRERWIQLLGGTLPAIGLGLALAALQDLPHDNSMCPYPVTIAEGSHAPQCPEKPQ